MIIYFHLLIVLLDSVISVLLTKFLYIFFFLTFNCFLVYINCTKFNLEFFSNEKLIFFLILAGYIFFFQFFNFFFLSFWSFINEIKNRSNSYF